MRIESTQSLIHMRLSRKHLGHVGSEDDTFVPSRSAPHTCRVRRRRSRSDFASLVVLRFPRHRPRILPRCSFESRTDSCFSPQHMAKTTSDFLIERLQAWGVNRVYGYPGDGINGIMGALERADGAIDFVQVRHEEMAAFMACAHAKFTGEVGVCMATSGPGAIHLLNGLYDAKMDHQPVVAIVGQSSRLAMGGSYQQEVDLQSLFKDVASDYCQTAMAPAAMRHLIDRAFRIARAQRSVTCIIIPNDLQEEPYEDPPHKHSTVHSGVGYTSPRIVPEDADLRRAAEVLNAGTKVAMLIGAGTFRAMDEVVASRRPPRLRRRQSAPRQGGAAGRAPLRHRLDRPPRHEAELGR